MKLPYIIAIFTSVIGFAAGWLFKPAPVQADNTSTASDQTPTQRPKKVHSAGNSEAPTTSNSTSPSGTSSDASGDEATEEEREEQRAEQRREWQTRMAERMQERQQGRFDRQLEQLTAKLNLTPEQVEQMKALYASKLQAYSDLTGQGLEGMRNAETVQQLAAVLGEDDVNSTLASILSPEQSKEYTELKTRERTNQIEASTMQNMASLQSNLDLDEEQKDAVYAILYEQASQKANNPSPYDTLANSMGGGRWFTGQQLEDHLSVSNDNGIEDREARQAKMQELQEQRVNAQVQALQGVLDENQLKSYKEMLQQGQFRGGRGGRRGGR